LVHQAKSFYLPDLLKRFPLGMIHAPPGVDPGSWKITIYSQEVKVLVKVVKRNGESEQQLMRRFRKAVSRSGKMSEVRKRRWFISKNEERRLAKKKAIRRQKRRQWKRERRR